MYISNILSFIYVICLANVAILMNQVSAEIQTLNQIQLNEAINSTRLVLAHIRSKKECDEKCETNHKFLSSVQNTLAIYEVKVYDAYSPKLLKPYKSGEKDTNNRLFFYRNGVPLLYEAEELKSEELVDFIQQHNNLVYSRSLNDHVFEHQTQASTGSTTGDWFILFYSPECDEYLSLWETLGARLVQHKVLATLNMVDSPVSTQRFKASSCPSAYYLRAGKYYPYEQPMELKKLVLFAEGWYKNAPSHPIKPLPTAFDTLLDTIVSAMKQRELVATAVVALAAVVVLLLLVVCCKRCCSKPKPKLY